MKVLAIIDMQKDFIDGALGTKEAVAIVPKVAARLAQARADGETVVFTRDTHHADYLSTQEGRKLPVPHCLEGPDGWQIAAALAVEDAPVFANPGFGSPAVAPGARGRGIHRPVHRHLRHHERDDDQGCAAGGPAVRARGLLRRRHRAEPRDRPAGHADVSDLDRVNA